MYSHGGRHLSNGAVLIAYERKVVLAIWQADANGIPTEWATARLNSLTDDEWQFGHYFKTITEASQDFASRVRDTDR